MTYRYDERLQVRKVLGGLAILTIGMTLGLILAYYCIIWGIDHMMVEAPVVK